MEIIACINSKILIISCPNFSGPYSVMSKTKKPCEEVEQSFRKASVDRDHAMILKKIVERALSNSIHSLPVSKLPPFTRYLVCHEDVSLSSVRLLVD
jgi:hypothetical protein